MTRFAREWNGELGAFWQKNAHEEAARLLAQRDNIEVEVEFLVVANPQRALAGGHSVAERHVDRREEALKAGFTHRTVHHVAHGNLAVEHGDGNAVLRTGLERVAQRCKV